MKRQIGDSMRNSAEKREINKINQFDINVCRYPGASSIDIIDHLKPSIGKALDEIIIHAGTNNITNNVNYLLIQRKEDYKISP